MNPGRRWTALAGACGAAALLAGKPLSTAAEPERSVPRDANVDVALHGRLPFRVFTARDGLPQNSIQKMAVDRSGNLWVGTLDGAARYDGRSWTVVNMPDRTVSNQVEALLASADGGVWLGTAGAELARLKDGQWTRYGAGSGLPGVRIRSLVESTDAGGSPVLWVGTDAGLGRLAQGRWSVVDRTTGLPDNDVLAVLETPAEGGGRVLWVGMGAGGLSRLDGGLIGDLAVSREGLDHLETLVAEKPRRSKADPGTRIREGRAARCSCLAPTGELIVELEQVPQPHTRERVRLRVSRQTLANAALVRGR